MVATTGEEEVRQKTMLAFTSGSLDDMADVISTFPVSMQAMAEAGMLVDNTEFLAPFKDKFVAGAYDQIVYKGKLYCLPRSLRPQLLFYNKEIFDKYGIDPNEMKTFEGYLEVGRKLKQTSNGEVFLSYEDPATRTWRYWGRRGLMPQAGAKIWDDDGNVVIDKDPGALKAFKYFETLHKEGLLFNSKILEPPLYEATRQGKVATYLHRRLLRRVPQGQRQGHGRQVARHGSPGLQGPQPRRRAGRRYRASPPSPTRRTRSCPADLVRLQLRQRGTQGLHPQGAQGKRPACRTRSPRRCCDEPSGRKPDPYYGGQSFKQMEGWACRTSR